MTSVGREKRWRKYWTRWPLLWSLAIACGVVMVTQHIGYTLLVAGIAYWVIRLSMVKFIWRTTKGIPGKPQHFLYGNIHLLDQKNPLPQLIEWCQEFKGLCRIDPPLGWPPVIVIADPNILKTVMATNDTPKSLFYEVLFYDWLGLGLLTSNGSLWKTRRNLLTPAFHFDILRKYVRIFEEQARIFISKIEPFADTNQSINIFPYVTRLTLDIITQCAFGTNVRAQTDEEPSEYVKAVFELSEICYYRLFRPYLLNGFLFSLTERGRRFKKAVQVVHNLPEKVIAERRAIHEKNSGKILEQKRLDFLDILLEAEDAETGAKLDDIEIREEVDTFMFEGHDTTASGLTWALYCLAQHPDIQKRVQEEVDRVLGDRDAPTFDDIQELKYMEKVFKEVLRMYPPVPVVLRQTNKPLKVSDDIIIPPNTELILVFYALHYDPRFWENPHEFNPERFNKSVPPFVYMPFSAGNRNCIGKSFAQMEEKCLLAMLLKKFTFEIDPTHVVEPAIHLILRPANGVKLYIKRR